MIKRYFPGANTPQGYVSLFDDIISWPDANKIFIIKGGPGVGKSTLMKKLARSLHKENINLELLYCTSDSNSIDGLILTDYKISILDGTEPHTLDPKYPGCVDEIINLGIFWDEYKIKKHRKEIVDLSNKISAYYKSAYSYLKAAKTIDDDSRNIYEAATDYSQIRIIVKEIYEGIFSRQRPKDSSPRTRQMFASAITADGYVNHIDSLFSDVENRYIIKGPNSKCKSIIFKNILSATQQIGYDVDIFKNPMNPSEIEHIFIPELNSVFLSFEISNESKVIKSDDKVFDLSLSMPTNELQHKVIDYNRNVYEKLLNRAIELLGETKFLHNKLESIYSTNMKFDCVDDVTFNILEKIKKCIKEI